MFFRQLLCLGSLAALGLFTAANSVSAQTAETVPTNLSDVSGGQTYSSPSVSIDGTNGNGFSNVTQYNPTSGTIKGGGIDQAINVGSASGSGSDSGNGAGDGIVSGNKPVAVSLNDVAKLLDDSLDVSLDNLAAVEQESQVATASRSGTRRIARRNSRSAKACGCVNPTSAVPRRIVRSSPKVCGCPNPTVAARGVQSRKVQARQIVQKQLNESKKFIEQANRIEPDKNIW